ncbi:mitovirus RNA-dependent RNA polymerase [Striga asiatica]|uniref:Mitovirus RNA-dependent RNA polymerase n=1 Tax=Striga asiatica TaxID=4170 RepID=A0A5A7Q1R4_STRAF|nr:mitovirus RNA-dependent RNA polymerase [Striga asiatica]
MQVSADTGSDHEERGTAFALAEWVPPSKRIERIDVIEKGEGMFGCLRRPCKPVREERFIGCGWDFPPMEEQVEVLLLVQLEHKAEKREEADRLHLIGFWGLQSRLDCPDLLTYSRRSQLLHTAPASPGDPPAQALDSTGPSSPPVPSPVPSPDARSDPSTSDLDLPIALLQCEDGQALYSSSDELHVAALQAWSMKRALATYCCCENASKIVSDLHAMRHSDVTAGQQYWAHMMRKVTGAAFVIMPDDREGKMFFPNSLIKKGLRVEVLLLLNPHMDSFPSRGSHPDHRNIGKVTSPGQAKANPDHESQRRFSTRQPACILNQGRKKKSHHFFSTVLGSTDVPPATQKSPASRTPSAALKAPEQEQAASKKRSGRRFALCHHFVVWCAAEEENPGRRFRDYALLGAPPRCQHGIGA